LPEKVGGTLSTGIGGSHCRFLYNPEATSQQEFDSLLRCFGTLSRCKSQELRAKGDGILKFGKKLGIGTSVVQRVFKQEQVSLIGQKGLCPFDKVRGGMCVVLGLAWLVTVPKTRESDSEADNRAGLRQGCRLSSS
jgi:hypothetical protein